MPVITIRGQFGSWANDIGELMARRLNIDYVDRKIIAEVAERLRQPSRNIEEKEMLPSTLWGRIAEVMGRTYIGDCDYTGIIPPLWGMPLWEISSDDTKYLSGLEHVIKEMAESQSIVIRGRGSQFILKDFPGAFHVLIVAPVEVRVKRVMEFLKLNEEDARKEISRFDNGNREFAKRYFQAEINDPVHYDIVVNTNHFSIEGAASVMIAALNFKEKLMGG